MFMAILIAVTIPAVIVLTAWWAHQRYRGKIHLVWGNASTMGDDSLNEAVEDHRITKLKLNERELSSDSSD